ncbi:MAG TPA: two-component regulator propeller domain-containing protein [Anaerolineales bacterium]|nr:two-component regulator propeller domain-containing protein [Anaerolineales bacterium]
MNRTIIVVAAHAAVVFSLLCTTPGSAQTDTIRFENISTDQGLSQATVNTILQDQQGFMWFGTEGGLNRYDGYQFTVYQHDPDDPGSLSDNLVLATYEDRNGILWIGTSVGLDRFDRTSGTFTHYSKELTPSGDGSGTEVSAIDQDRSGTLWVGTYGSGLNALDLTTDRITTYRHHQDDPRSLSNDSINSIYISPAGEVWICTDGGLDRFDPKTRSFDHFLLSALGSPIADNVPVRAVYQDYQGMMWIGTLDGLIRWDRAANRFVLYQHEPNDPESLSDNSVKRVFEDSQGALWIGTLRGLNQFDSIRNRFIRYIHDPNDPSSLSSDYVRSIFEDRSGVLWVGTSFGGLNKYARSTQKFQLDTNQPGLPNNLSDNNVWSIYEDQSGNLWIGTFFSGLNKLDARSGSVTIYRHDPSNPTSLSDDEIRAILQDRNGVFWIGTENGGLNRFDPATGAFLHYQNNAGDPASLSSDHVFCIYEDHLGRLWIGTELGGLDRFDQPSGTFVHYQHNADDPLSLSDDNVRAIYEDHTGNLWIGTEKGGLDLWNERDHGFKIYRHDPADPASLSSDWVLSILEDKNGNLWFGTLGGLDRLDRTTQSFAHYTVKSGLPDNTIYGILEDADGNLWLSTNKGLSKFNPAAGTFRNYDTGDGLQGDQSNPGAYFQSQHGEMFFGGVKGFNSFFPRQVHDNPIPPPVVISDIKKYNQTLRTNLVSNESVRLSYSDNFISFDFSALDYNAPAKNQYAYQLVGVDPDWVYAGTRRYASYTNLPGGDYAFRVKASNNDGIWNETGTTLQIHITPPFWQTWWFMGIIGLTLISGAVGGYRLRVRDVEARNRALAQRVEQRTHELAALNGIAVVVNSSLDLTEILNNALDQVLAVLHMDVGLAFRLEESILDSSGEGVLKLLAYRGVSNDFVQAVRSLPLRMTVFRNAEGADKPILCKSSDHPDAQVREANQREGIQAEICIPLLVKGRLVGAVIIAAREPRPILGEELSLLAAIGQQVGMAVENARLYEQAEETAATTERNRLARELHDSVTQLIYSVTLYAEAATELLGTGETETAAEHLRELRDTAQEALREMRLLIFELRRPALGKSGLAGALQARLDAVESRGGMHAELQVEGVEQLPRSAQEELYNIAQEALNNALKHGRANRVQIRLRFEDAGTELEISDDGIGFEPTIKRLGGGFGISGMKERAQKLGGRIEIQTAPGKGTRVSVRVPARPSEHLKVNETESSPKEREG